MFMILHVTDENCSVFLCKECFPFWPQSCAVPWLIPCYITPQIVCFSQDIHDISRKCQKFSQFWVSVPIVYFYLSLIFVEIFSSVRSLSRVWLFETPWIVACQASLSITISQSSLTHVHHVSDAIRPSHPLLSPSSPAPNPSQHQSIFQWANSLHEVDKVLEFQL